MKTRLHTRIVSFLFAALLTSAMLGGIDGLASQGEASAAWAAAVLMPRA
jgi:hypothetical protein